MTQPTRWPRLAPALLIPGLLVLAGCAPTPQASPPAAVASAVATTSQLAVGGDKEITVPFDSPQFWKDQAVEFTQATGIKVIYEDVPFGQLHDKYLASFVAGSSDYDVVHLRDDWVAEFGAKGFLEPLDARVTQDLKAQHAPNSFEYLSYKGHTYGVPRYLWLWQLYYNRDIVTQPPTTWAELASTAEKATSGGHYGYIMTLGDVLPVNEFTIRLRTEGGELFDRDKKPTFNTPEGAIALRDMVALVQKKVIDPSSFELNITGGTTDIFNQGSIGMMLSTPQVFALANDASKSKVVGKVEVALVPGSKLKSASYSELGGVGIPSASKKKDLSWEYIKFVTNAAQQKKMALALGRIPSRPDTLADPDVQGRYPNFKIVAEQVQYPMGMAVTVPQASEVNRALSKALTSALHGEVSTEQALTDGEKAVRTILGL